MKIKTFVAGMVALVFAMSAAMAQNAVVTTGGDIAADNYLFSFTVGQIAQTTAQSVDATVVEGVQQPLSVEVQSIDAVDALPTVSIFPNPTDAIVTLRREADGEPARVVLYDASGRQLESQTWTGASLSLDLTAQPSGAYIVRVAYSDNRVKNYKIIKR